MRSFQSVDGRNTLGAAETDQSVEVKRGRQSVERVLLQAHSQPRLRPAAAPYLRKHPSRTHAPPPVIVAPSLKRVGKIYASRALIPHRLMLPPHVLLGANQCCLPHEVRRGTLQAPQPFPIRSRNHTSDTVYQALEWLAVSVGVALWFVLPLAECIARRSTSPESLPYFPKLEKTKFVPDSASLRVPPPCSRLDPGHPAS